MTEPAQKELWVALTEDGTPIGPADGGEAAARATAAALTKTTPEFGPYRAQRYVLASPRCLVKQAGTDVTERATFLGLMYDHDDVVAVVRLDGHGMFVTTVHPSRVELLSEGP